MGDRRVALLRGINVGRAKRVPMAELRALLRDLGYEAVSTLLNSGNAVFTVPPDGGSPEPAGAIERALEERLGVSALTVVLTAEEVDAVVRGNPFTGVATDPARYLVGFLAGSEDAERLRELAARDWGGDALALGGRVAYLWCAAGILGSPLPAAVSRAARERVTTRNWTTVLRIRAALEVE